MGNLESFWAQGEGEVVAQFWSRTAAEQVHIPFAYCSYANP